MKPVFFVAIVIILAVACHRQPIATAENRSYEGTWVPVKEEFGGKVLPESAFANDRLILKDSTYSYGDNQADRGIVKRGVNGRLDIYGRVGPNAGKHFTAASVISGDHMKICYDLTGQTYPQEFATKEGTLLFLAEFVRKK